MLRNWLLEGNNHLQWWRHSIEEQSAVRLSSLHLMHWVELASLTDRWVTQGAAHHPRSPPKSYLTIAH